MDLVLAGERDWSREGSVGSSGRLTAILQRPKLWLKRLIESLQFFSAVNVSVKLDWDFQGFLAHLWLTPYIGINVCKHNVDNVLSL